MGQSTQEFLERFVVPLLGGGRVAVGTPLRLRDRDTMLVRDRDALQNAQLGALRVLRAQEVTAAPNIPEPDDTDLSLWVGLHNALALDHPERPKVWSRASIWRRVEGATRLMLSLPSPENPSEALARHASVGAFIELTRYDVVLPTVAGEMRYLGQDVPQRYLRLVAGGRGRAREETVQWLMQPHVPETHRLIENVMRASPLSCLLYPLLAPPGWSPLWAASCLDDRSLVRAICHRWARHPDWISVGGAVMTGLLPSLATEGDGRRGEERNRTEGEGAEPDGVVAGANVDADPAHRGPLALPGVVLPDDPATLSAVYGCLVHLHFLKVLELDMRLGMALASRDAGIMAFVALPLLLPWLGDRTGTPLGDRGSQARESRRDPFETAVARRWAEYVGHLEELVPRGVVENLLATLVPAIVKPT